jgi:hypothetical protein
MSGVPTWFQGLGLIWRGYTGDGGRVGINIRMRAEFVLRRPTPASFLGLHRAPGSRLIEMLLFRNYVGCIVMMATCMITARNLAASHDEPAVLHDIKAFFASKFPILAARLALYHGLVMDLKL